MNGQTNSFKGVRAVVIDEIHAFAGDDRGWHLLAVLERVSCNVALMLLKKALVAGPVDGTLVRSWRRTTRHDYKLATLPEQSL